MQAAEKRQLDSIKSLYASAFKLKLKLQELMFKLETQGERCDWPNYLNTLGLCASELNEIRKFVESERFPQADSLVLTPLLLSPDPDPILGKATEERLSVFNHDSVPQYLRTRLDPHVSCLLNFFLF
ncbi:unnamed protein product [Protopolystoma xenopodis]|uniref:Mediator of RNA polymerase II transcription subunit 8 n=1 Tax=Protopolystoma xenopodis TaxID=117903 RepID=A0A448X0Y7_9PLAT|nr:unnamed protein product [Protopolystoma xenopodis]